MKRHLPGFLVFVLIVGLSIAVYAVGRSLARSFDAAAVPPIDVDEPLRSSSSRSLNYLARLVQYDQQTRRLTARLEINRDSLGDRSALELVVAVNSSDNGVQSYRQRTVGKVLPGDGQKAIVMVEISFPGRAVLVKDHNYYASFDLGGDGASSQSLDKATPIVFIHPRPASQRGPVILR